jgi:chromate reductase, NAD(P)H dehydrogenase (quinone)
MRILGISGSLRQDSHNTRLLRAAAEVSSPLGAELEIVTGLEGIPPFTEEQVGEPAPDSVTALRQVVADADAVLIASPEYNGSIPGQLKNVLDWLSRPWPDNALRNKPVAVIGASTGMFGAAWAQADARKVLKTIGARVIGPELPVARAHEAFVDTAEGESERLADDALHARLESILAELVEAVRLREARRDEPIAA